MSLIDVFHSVATGPLRRRTLLTPVGLLFFGGVLSAIVVAGLISDRALGLPPLLPGATGVAVGAALLAAGVATCASCVVRFIGARGTPVPFNPPRELVVRGPYAFVRNPMLTGVFGVLFGLGLLLHSFSMVILWVPLFIFVNVIELKTVEEPELERRFGATYRDYRRRVPMFIPRGLRARRQGPSR